MAGSGSGAEPTDPICALAGCATRLLVARASGIVHVFGLPGLSLEARHVLRCRPVRLALNADATRLAVIDFGGMLSMLDTGSPSSGAGSGAAGIAVRGEHLAVERKVRRWVTDGLPSTLHCQPGTRSTGLPGCVGHLLGF